MFEVTIKGNSLAELFKNATAIVGALAPTVPGEASPLSPTEQSRLRADATVVPPKDKAAEKAAAKAAEKAAKLAAEKAAAEKAKDDEKEADESGDESTDDDVLEDGGDEGEAELTHDDVKNLLLEVRKAYPAKNTIISEIVKEHGKATKISEVEAKNLPAVAKKARELLAKAKK